MARERTTIVVCAESGCTVSTFYTYTSNREYGEIRTRQTQRPWKCTRHDRPEQVLRPDNTSTVHVLVASRIRDLPGLFWLAEGSDVGGSGLQSGPGFTAHASDFPEGTRLVVATRIESPTTGDDA